MTPFAYSKAPDLDVAVQNGRAGVARYLGGGTNLVDLLRQNVEAATELVDVSRLPGKISETDVGGLIIGASVKNSVFAAHPVVRTRYPMLSRALLAGASAQIRNMASVGGNILQRTRCTYFYDVAGSRCNKREPGSGCDAREGFNRYHAILGASDSCIATFPSDMCVALAALDAVVHIVGNEGGRSVPLVDFHLLPGSKPQIETVLRPGELITAVELPSASQAMLTSDYRKVRDRSSYAFALVSVAAGLAVRDGRIVEARIALGGLAAKPWRATKAEAALLGHAPARELFAAAAAEELAGARTFAGNAFKPGLARRTIAAVLESLTGDAA